jgi:hypothetical protein
MRPFVFALLACLLASTTLIAQDSPPADNNPEIEKKLKALREQIEELKKKQDALVKEQNDLVAKQAEARRTEAERKAKELAERRAKEEASKKIHYVKVEIRGTLRKGQTGGWNVVINELTWVLDFGKNKDLVAAAGKLDQEGVVITGKVVAKRQMNWQPYVWPGTGWPVPPDAVPPGWPMPNNRPPGNRWEPNYVPYQFEPAVIIQVESITAAKD